VGKVKKIKPVKLVIGVFSNDFELIEAIKGNFQKKFGQVDYESSFLPFSKTNYYQKEMGDNLKRKIFAFKRLIFPDLLPRIKKFTNYLEEKFAQDDGKRRINIDPGYLTLAKFILATTKDYSHRLYLQQGIYAEGTLHYKDGSFKPWEWTYPDYCQKEYIEIFNQIRNIYIGQIKTDN